jgi:predicted MPP superfamily phosphohydrolase
LEEGLVANGWTGLINRTEVIDDGEVKIRIAGTDDPYLRRHRMDHAERSGDEDLAIALIHAPDIVSEWLLAGFDLVLAGHTHAGQVRMPLVGALMTNCSLPLELAGGLHKIGRGWLHVSPGLGTSTYSPIRFLARPEATLLTLKPASA